jgi:hypothetical protein
MQDPRAHIIGELAYVHLALLAMPDHIDSTIALAAEMSKPSTSAKHPGCTVGLGWSR